MAVRFKSNLLIKLKILRNKNSYLEKRQVVAVFRKIDFLEIHRFYPLENNKNYITKRSGTGLCSYEDPMVISVLVKQFTSLDLP